MGSQRVVVAGANGFIGAHLVRGFLRSGHEVHGLVRPGANTSRLHALGVDAGDHLLIAHGYEPDELRSTFERLEANVVVNAVGYGLDPNQRSLDNGFAINVRAALDIVEAAAAVGADAIHLGSAYEYEMGRKPIDEHVAVSPETFYGITKATASSLLKLNARSLSNRLMIVRPFGLYGPTETPQKLVPAIVNSCLDRRPQRLSEARKVRDYTFIDDAVEAFIAFVGSGADWPEVVNIGSGVPVSLRHIVGRICSILDVDESLFEWGALPARIGDPMYLVADPTLVERVFGWRSTTSMDDGLKATIGSIVAARRAAGVAPSL